MNDESESDSSTTSERDQFTALVDADVAGYINGGAGEGDTVWRNAAAWQQWVIVPRVGRDMSVVDATVTVFGQHWRAPVMVAPWGNHSLVHQHAEAESARGAVAAGVGFGLSGSSSLSLSEVSAAAGPFLQQLYLPQSREQAKPFLERAVTAGAWGIALTVDAPSVSSGFSFRTRVGSTSGTVSPNWPDGIPRGSASDQTFSDISWIAHFTGLPVLTKGVLHPDDAVASIEGGAAGVIVSNHGGRQIDGSITTAEMLPEVVAAVNGRVPVLVDGGVRRPEDVFRAIALGAQAVLIGRPSAWALASGGADGVTAYYSTLVERFTGVMVSAGARSVDQITRDMVRWRAW